MQPCNRCASGGNLGAEVGAECEWKIWTAQVGQPGPLQTSRSGHGTKASNAPYLHQRAPRHQKHAGNERTPLFAATEPIPLENVLQVTAPGQFRPTALSHRLHPEAKPLDLGPGSIRMAGNSGLVILSLIVLDPIPEQAGIPLEPDLKRTQDEGPTGTQVPPSEGYRAHAQGDDHCLKGE